MRAVQLDAAGKNTLHHQYGKTQTPLQKWSCELNWVLRRLTSVAGIAKALQPPTDLKLSFSDKIVLHVLQTEVLELQNKAKKLAEEVRLFNQTKGNT